MFLSSKNYAIYAPKCTNHITMKFVFLQVDLRSSFLAASHELAWPLVSPFSVPIMVSSLSPISQSLRYPISLSSASVIGATATALRSVIRMKEGVGVPVSAR